ncbi:MAG: 4-(cytidine 5'-diphospho)-2-C-methyl-D-erythritol kinase, partial [Eggerthellaceae bacterium]
MNYVKLIAPAKINLVLAVGEKLPDGYHEAHTILQALALHDTLEIRSFPAEPGAGLSITLKCESSNMIDQLTIDQEGNIVYKAAVELASALGRAEDEEIHIY